LDPFTQPFQHLFTSNVEENVLKLDYLLKPRIATIQNNIVLIKYLDYPKEINEKAEREN